MQCLARGGNRTTWRTCTRAPPQFTLRADTLRWPQQWGLGAAFWVTSASGGAPAARLQVCARARAATRGLAQAHIFCPSVRLRSSYHVVRMILRGGGLGQHRRGRLHRHCYPLAARTDRRHKPTRGCTEGGLAAWPPGGMRRLGFVDHAACALCGDSEPLSRGGQLRWHRRPGT